VFATGATNVRGALVSGVVTAATVLAVGLLLRWRLSAGGSAGDGD